MGGVSEVNRERGVVLDLSASIASWLAAVELEDCVAETADELRGCPGFCLEKVHGSGAPKRARAVSKQRVYTRSVVPSEQA